MSLANERTLDNPAFWPLYDQNLQVPKMSDWAHRIDNSEKNNTKTKNEFKAGVSSSSPWGPVSRNF